MLAHHQQFVHLRILTLLYALVRPCCAGQGHSGCCALPCSVVVSLMRGGRRLVCDSDSLLVAGVRLMDAGCLDEAVLWFERAAHAGDSGFFAGRRADRWRQAERTRPWSGWIGRPISVMGRSCALRGTNSRRPDAWTRLCSGSGGLLTQVMTRHFTQQVIGWLTRASG